MYLPPFLLHTLTQIAQGQTPLWVKVFIFLLSLLLILAVLCTPT